MEKSRRKRRRSTKSAPLMGRNTSTLLATTVLWCCTSDTTVDCFSPLRKIYQREIRIPQGPFLPAYFLSTTLVVPQQQQSSHHRFQSRRQQSLFGPTECSDDEEEDDDATEKTPKEELRARLLWNAKEDAPEGLKIQAAAPTNSSNIIDKVVEIESSPRKAKAMFKRSETGADSNTIQPQQPAVVVNEKDDSKAVGFSCRIVASSDGKIPTQRSLLPGSLYKEPPALLAKLDAIYHATAHEQTRFLKFMEKAGSSVTSRSNQLQQRASLAPSEEDKAISVLRNSLEDSGFNLMNRRDLDLCQALNAEYLLRLSILEDLSELDGSIAKEFYPELYETFENGTVVSKDNNDTDTPDNFLYDGRVLVFWRGYGRELTRSRLLLPKIDYLQANIVQRGASRLRVRLNVVEKALAVRGKSIYDRVEYLTMSFIAHALEMIPSQRVSEWARAKIVEMTERTKLEMKEEKRKRKDDKVMRLQRYGGATDALTPFMICEVEYENSGEATPKTVNGNTTSGGSAQFDSETVNHDIYEAMNRGRLSCQYDEAMATGTNEPVPPMQLLERVSISNLVDFSPSGTGNLFKTIIGKNELTEPTYQEVIVVWRPLPPKPQLKPIITPPKFIYDFADMFDIEGLPDLPKPKEEEEIARPPLEIRAFASVPMANLPAVLPKTKLVFRPADAFVFDLVSIVSLILVIGSQRFDNPRLDLLALVSFSLWLFRTFIRYSNKLARYDLLVKKFLTSKITARNAGALKYLSVEAGSYRATRAALVYTWLTSPQRKVTAGSSNDRQQLIKDGLLGVNGLIAEDKQVRVDIDAALRDLEDLELVFFSENGTRLEKVVRDNSSVVTALSNIWSSVFEGGKNLANVTMNSPNP